MSKKCKWAFAKKKQAIRSFVLLSWATLANHSHSFFCHERLEQFAHSRSFGMSDLSNLLTVAHLSWAIWANRSQSLIWSEQSELMSEWVNMSEWAMSKWTMSEWANFQPCLYNHFSINGWDWLITNKEKSPDTVPFFARNRGFFSLPYVYFVGTSNHSYWLPRAFTLY